VNPLALRAFYVFVLSLPFESLETSFTSGSFSLSNTDGISLHSDIGIATDALSGGFPGPSITSWRAS
jgi:hypothetical protein